ADMSRFVNAFMKRGESNEEALLGWLIKLCRKAHCPEGTALAQERGLAAEGPWTERLSIFMEEYLRCIGDKARLLFVIEQATELDPYPDLQDALYKEMEQWPKQAQRKHPWDKVRIVVEISTTSALSRSGDIRRSPFNVPPIVVGDLDVDQAHALA